MPTYVYRCQKCGAVLERRQSFQDPPLTVCEICSGELRRVLQPVSVIFRGSGFYSTDYRHDPAVKQADGKPALAKSAEDHPRRPAELGDTSTSPASSDGASPAAPASPSTSSSTE